MQISEDARDIIALKDKLTLRNREIEALKCHNPSELEQQFKHQIRELVHLRYESNCLGRENYELKNSLFSADVSVTAVTLPLLELAPSYSFQFKFHNIIAKPIN